MNRIQVAQLFGRPFFRGLVGAFAPLRLYGTDRIPRHGPLILCFNHFSWLDPWAIGSGIPRTVYYVAKQEAHDAPLMGRSCGAVTRSGCFRREHGRSASQGRCDPVRR